MELMERLSAHKTIGSAPREQLAWLAAHGQLRHFAVGDIVNARRAGRVEGLLVLLSGRIALHVERGAGRHKIIEWRGGDVTGMLPYSRLVAAPGDSVAEEDSEVLIVPTDDLPEMIRECHELTSILVHVMLDRARHFTSSQLHDEKLVSLGKLAAGLAHELNNPAAAIRRGAKLLPESVAAAESASRVLGASKLTEDELSAVARLRDACVATPIRAVRSPVDEAQREEAVADWLEGYGVDGSAAEALAGTPLSLAALDRLAASVREDVLEPVLRWLAADCAVRALAMELEQAGTRISDLVTAVKGFTQVDAAAVPRAVQVGEGLVHTLAVVKGKARAKAIRLVVHVADPLPSVRGFAAELNQIWANLIDNALDAAPDGGSVEVRAAHEGPSVVVRVIDDGAGIAPDVRDRIFDPFFTTKDVGQGMGLGLDIVHRLVRRHDGDIEAQSRPGRTEFIVSLPVLAPDGGDA
jgi:signal transduction histidine kinase